MLDALIFRLHMWLFKQWLFHSHMHDLYKGMKPAARERNKEACAEFHKAENSIWQTYIHTGRLLIVPCNEWCTPPAA